MLRHTLIAFALGSLVAPSSAAAQQQSLLKEGTRVRITPHDGARVSGQLSLTPLDSLIIFDRNERRVALATMAVRQVEVHAGRRSHKARGALLGGAAGGLIGLLVGAASGDACGLDAYQTCSTGASVLGGGIMIGAAGSLIGTVIGTPRRDAWQVVPGPWRISSNEPSD